MATSSCSAPPTVSASMTNATQGTVVASRMPIAPPDADRARLDARHPTPGAASATTRSVVVAAFGRDAAEVAVVDGRSPADETFRSTGADSPEGFTTRLPGRYSVAGI